MPIGDIIGGAQQPEASTSDVRPQFSRAADSAGETFENWLNERTPPGVDWTLNFSFIVTLLSGLSGALMVIGKV